MARFSVLGFKSVATLKAQGNILEIEKDGDKHQIDIENPFDEIKKIISSIMEKKDSVVD